MTREEEINKAYDKWQDDLECSERTVWKCACEWADEHPKNLWRDAKTDPPERKIGNKICYTFLDTAFNGVNEQRYYHFAEYKKYGFGEKGWLDEDGNLVLVEIADYWMPIPELPEIT